jgi:hypothetical protein
MTASSWSRSAGTVSETEFTKYDVEQAKIKIAVKITTVQMHLNCPVNPIGSLLSLWKWHPLKDAKKRGYALFAYTIWYLYD